MPTDLTDDELLNVPLANLQPGELRRAFLVEARATEKKQEESVSVQRTLAALQGRKEEEQSEHERREFERREEILLAGIQDREHEIFEEAEQLDRRTIKLHDGRRVYVDGDRYRDAEGRELHGADRAEAEQLHLVQPHAATWQEKQTIDQDWHATEQLKKKVEGLKAGDGGVDDQKALGNYEAEYQHRIARRESQVPTAPSYGSGDYTAALGGLSGDFRQATTAAPGASPSAMPAAAPPRTAPGLVA